MRLLHTSDWHLGHALHGLSRRGEHLAFFDWLLGKLEEHCADALLIAGDIFDTSNPSAEAQADFYDFVVRAKQRAPKLDLVIIGGNHDSASRLDAPVPLLQRLGVHMVGGLPRKSDQSLDLTRLVVPLTDRDGAVRAQLIAMPFLRPVDLPVVKDPKVDPLIEGVRRLYAEALAHAETLRQSGQALVAMGHLYMTGTELSELSERKILGGNQHALPVDVFPDSLAYVALGHLHLAQRVGRESVRYSGSPIPLSMTELHYPHQICVIDLEGERLAQVRHERIPRTVELLRVPSQAQPIETVLTELDALPSYAHLPTDARPILEVPVALEQPEPGLRARIEKALENKAVRLARIATHYTGTGQTLADGLPPVRLDSLQPEEVLQRRWSRLHQGELPAELLGAFHELLGELRSGTEAP